MSREKSLFSTSTFWVFQRQSSNNGLTATRLAT